MLAHCKKSVGGFIENETYGIDISKTVTGLYRVQHLYGSAQYYCKDLQSFFDHWRVLDGIKELEEAVKSEGTYRLEYKWIIKEEEDKVQLHCPNCGRYNKIVKSYWKKIEGVIPSMMMYCGYCGHQNIEEV